MEFLNPKTSCKTSGFFLNDAMFWRFFWKNIDVDVLDDVLQNAKHRPNDASNDVNRPPLLLPLILFSWQKHCSTHFKFQCSLHCVRCFLHCGFLWSTFCLSLHSGLYCALSDFPADIWIRKCTCTGKSLIICASTVKHIFGKYLIVLVSKLGFSLA